MQQLKDLIYQMNIDMNDGEELSPEQMSYVLTRLADKIIDIQDCRDLLNECLTEAKRVTI